MPIFPCASYFNQNIFTLACYLYRSRPINIFSPFPCALRYQQQYIEKAQCAVALLQYQQQCALVVVRCCAVLLVQYQQQCAVALCIVLVVVRCCAVYSTSSSALLRTCVYIFFIYFLFCNSALLRTFCRGSLTLALKGRR